MGGERYIENILGDLGGALGTGEQTWPTGVKVSPTRRSNALWQRLPDGLRGKVRRCLSGR